MLGGDGAIPDIDCFMSNSRTVHSEAGKVQLNLEYLFQKIRKFSKNDVNISKNLWSDWNGILLAKFSTNWISKTKIVIMKHQFSSIQLCNDVWLFATPWLQYSRVPCSSPVPRACWNSCPSSLWCHPTISSSVIPFSSCLQSFSASGSFPVSWQLIFRTDFI